MSVLDATGTKRAKRITFVTARGHCRPFGATPEPSGVNFAVFSRHAERVHLLLFDPGSQEPIAEISLDPSKNKTGDVWHVFVADLPIDMEYSYRVYGPFLPHQGHRFNPQHVVLDPYARAISGGNCWGIPEVPHSQKAAGSRGTAVYSMTTLIGKATSRWQRPWVER